MFSDWQEDMHSQSRKENSGGFRKLSDDVWTELKRCLSPQHNPPGMIVLEPGTYEYTCPSCGATQVVVIPNRNMLKQF